VGLSRGTADTTLHALDRLDLDLAALAPAEAAGLLTVLEDGLVLRHPLLRSVLIKNATAAERTMVNATLADSAVPGSEEQAWYRASAVLGTDADAADALAMAAERTMAIGGPPAAVAAMMRSAALTPPGPTRARRLVSAAGCCLGAGQPSEVPALLDEAESHAPEVRIRAEIALVRGQYETFAGESERGISVITRGARDLAATDPERAAMMLGLCVVPTIMGGRLEIAGALALEGQQMVSGTGSDAELLCEANRDVALVILGRTRGLGDAISRLRELGPSSDLLLTSVPLVPALVWLEEYERAERMLGELTSEAYRQGAVAALPFHLGTRAQLYWRIGRWTEARAVAAEALDLGQLTGQPAMASYAAAWLAFLAAARGDEEGCRRHVKEIEPGVRAGSITLAIYASHASALLALGLGRNDEAADGLAETDRRVCEAQGHNPSVDWHYGDLVEALVHADRATEAERAVNRLAAALDEAPSRYGTVILPRSLALLAGDDDRAEAHYREAVDAPGGREIPFERARAAYLYGAWLRRRRRPRDARSHLRAAHATFTRLGATPWTERAASELRASGAGAELAAAPAPGDVLTAQELQVALSVSKGLSNREIAGVLFISPKTVEYHLGKVFKKLGLRSRAQLTRVMTESAVDPNAE
jgi:DNA-binding CsgD family transcriptional regulator